MTATVTCPRCSGSGLPSWHDGGDGEWCQECDGAGLVCKHCGGMISGIPDHGSDCLQTRQTDVIVRSIKELAELVATRAKRRIAELERLDRLDRIEPS